jgi:putative oxidoreductase
MLGAAVLAHRQNGFFINWNGNQKGEGFEFHILAIGLFLALVVGGAGEYSVDFNLIGKF